MISGCWALIPLKTSFQAKSRLSSTLSFIQRAGLQQAMLDDLVEGLSASTQLEGIALYGSNRKAVPSSGELAMVSLIQPDHVTNLNAAISDGTSQLSRMGAQLIAVIPGDLPLADGTELDRALSDVALTRAAVIVPDRRKEGTNALIFPAGEPPAFKMGRCSFQKHILGEPPCRPLELPTFALDIDTSADLKHLLEKDDSGSGRRTKLFLQTVLPDFAVRFSSKEIKA